MSGLVYGPAPHCKITALVPLGCSRFKQVCLPASLSSAGLRRSAAALPRPPARQALVKRLGCKCPLFVKAVRACPSAEQPLVCEELATTCL